MFAATIMHMVTASTLPLVLLVLLLLLLCLRVGESILQLQKRRPHNTALSSGTCAQCLKSLAELWGLILVSSCCR